MLNYEQTFLPECVEWFKRAKEFPTSDDLLVQTGCHFEEIGEMLKAMFGEYNSTCRQINTFADKFKGKDDVARLVMKEVLKNQDLKRELVDSLADTVVTAIGMLYMITGDPVGVLHEVNKSNWSKFEDGFPVFDENGKIRKGRGYHPPQLDDFI